MFWANILWVLCGGYLSALFWIVSGIIWCLTLVGIPFGIQCFKIAVLTCAPFGTEIRYRGGITATLGDIVWILFFGIPMALANFIFGCVWCLTIIGIPFGLQFFKIARISLAPFSVVVVYR